MTKSDDDIMCMGEVCRGEKGKQNDLHSDWETWQR